MKKIVFFFVVIGIIGVIQAQTLLARGVSCADKKIAVDYHNTLRKAIASGTLKSQPKASNMQKMMWDDNLAVVAQGWADKMIWDHNPLRSDPRFSVGENLYRSGSTSGTNTTAIWKTAIDNWHDEQLKYTYCGVGVCENLGTGHYTQVVWSNSIYVGCGYTFFRGTNGWFYKFYVCNYGPSGNYEGEFPYAKGAGCENLCCDTPCTVLYGTQCV